MGSIKKKSLLPCPYCSKKYESRNGLTAHVRIIHQGIRYKCRYCEKTFSQRRTLRLHTVKDHLPADLLPFHCGICDEGFRLWIDLKKHIKTHEDPEEVECAICSKMFTSRNNLKQHMIENHSSPWRHWNPWCSSRPSFSKMGIRTSHPELYQRRRPPRRTSSSSVVATH